MSAASHGSRSSRTAKLGVAMMAAASLLLIWMAIAPPATADPQANNWYVCKYVGTPGVNESLQTGQNPIFVDESAISVSPVFIGAEFQDAQGRSVVIAGPYFPNDKPDPEPDAGDCPPPDNPCPSGTTTVTATETQTTTKTQTFTTTVTAGPDATLRADGSRKADGDAGGDDGALTEEQNCTTTTTSTQTLTTTIPTTTTITTTPHTTTTSSPPPCPDGPTTTTTVTSTAPPVTHTITQTETTTVTAGGETLRASGPNPVGGVAKAAVAQADVVQQVPCESTETTVTTPTTTVTEHTTETVTTTPSVSGSTVTPPPTTSGSVAPTTTTPPGGTAFTGAEDVVPLGALALMLMSTGSGLLWVGSRRRRDPDKE